MNKLLEKLNYRGSKRIAVLNATESCISALAEEMNGLKIDREIDPRFPYDFIVIFVKNQEEIETCIPEALHNLMCDGVLWFCFPRKSRTLNHSVIDREHGWQTLNKVGFQGIRVVTFDDEWTALRFRSVKFIKSAAEKSAR